MMKRNVLALLLSMVLLLTFLPVYAEMDAPAQVDVSAPAQVESEPAAPAEEPVQEPTAAPAPQEPVEPEESSVPEPQEPDEEPTQEPGEEPTQEPAADPTAEPFTAQVSIKLENEGAIYYGDLVTLQAEVKEANGEYTVIWEYYNEEADIEHGENPWVALEEGEKYEFTVDEENAKLTYRAVVNGVIISDTYELPEVTARPDADAEEPEEEPEAELDPERCIEIHAEWEGEQLYFGDESTLVAELIGYDNAVYTVQWQTSKDDEEWIDVEDATELTYTMVITEENWQDHWRLIVNVTGVIVEE